MSYGYVYEVGWAGGATVAWLGATFYAAIGLPWGAYLSMALFSFVLGVIQVRAEAQRSPQ